MLLSLVFRLFLVWLSLHFLLNYLWLLWSNMTTLKRLNWLLYFYLFRSFSSSLLLFNNFYLFCLFLFNNLKWLDFNNRGSLNSNNFLLLDNFLNLFNTTNDLFYLFSRDEICLSGRYMFRSFLLYFNLILYWSLNGFFLFFNNHISWSWTWSFLLLNIRFS